MVDTEGNLYIWDAYVASHQHFFADGMTIKDHPLSKGIQDLGENTSVKEMVEYIEGPEGGYPPSSFALTEEEKKQLHETPSTPPFVDVMDGFDAMEGTAEERSGDSMFRNYWEDMQSFGQRFIDHPLDALKSVIWTADGELRSMGGFGLWLAREFHVRPGELGVDPNTIMRQIMQYGAEKHSELHKPDQPG
jgi:hypothetical protein